ncbi:hypothetical protein HYC85_030440 [Camellia sinensis]|uniref:Uncharacterized protein n=1 Tax=Camellia sinensis TaxID=4442 RepID=A0A7J7G0X8_CAMSI|nr:hypothetical protein HYC85_030439 [Camellia sinensis]KAF5934269.1 hypothetical protein HYC85_030440 [Camellia sinensis]
MKNSLYMLNTHSSIGSLKRPKHALFKDNKERGWPSPSWDFKASSSPLKSLKISVVKRPQHQNPGVHTKGHKMRPFKA